MTDGSQHFTFFLIKESVFYISFSSQEAARWSGCRKSWIQGLTQKANGQKGAARASSVGLKRPDGRALALFHEQGSLSAP